MTTQTATPVLPAPSWAATVALDTSPEGMVAAVSSTTPAPIDCDTTVEWNPATDPVTLTVHQYDYLAPSTAGLYPHLRDRHVDVGPLRLTDVQARALAAQITAALDATEG